MHQPDIFDILGQQALKVKAQRVLKQHHKVIPSQVVDNAPKPFRAYTTQVIAPHTVLCINSDCAHLFR